MSGEDAWLCAAKINETGVKTKFDTHDPAGTGVAGGIYLFFIQMASSRIYVFRDIALFKLACFHRAPRSILRPPAAVY